MISASLSVVLGFLAWSAGPPAVVPAIGLALGLNSILKSKGERPRRKTFWLACAGSILSGSAVTVALVSLSGAL